MAFSDNFPTWVNYPGSPSTPGAADLNRLQDNDRFLSRPPMAMAVRSLVDQSISHATLTPVRFDTEIFDNDQMYSTGGDVSHTITINTRGWYEFHGNVMWEAPPNGATPTGWRSLRIRQILNAASEEIVRVDQQPMPQAGLSGGQAVSQLWPCPAGSRFELMAMHSQGSTLQIAGVPPYGARFSARWVAIHGSFF